MVLLDAFRSSIVSSKRLDQVEVIAFQKFAKIARTAVHIRFWIEGVRYSELRRCLGHQLHQALCPFSRNGVRIEAAFCADHAIDEIRVKTVTVACSTYRVGHIHGWSRGRKSGRRSRRSWRSHNSRLWRSAWRRSRIRRRGRAQIRLNSFDFRGGYVNETCVVCSVQEKPGCVAHEDPLFMANRETVAKNRNLGGRRRQARGAEEENEREFDPRDNHPLLHKSRHWFDAHWGMGAYQIPGGEELRHCN